VKITRTIKFYREFHKQEEYERRPDELGIFGMYDVLAGDSSIKKKADMMKE
jgi:hypothetical protein